MKNTTPLIIALLITAFLFSCIRGETLRNRDEKVTTAPKKTQEFSSLAGWWNSKTICLDLTTHGEIELSFRRSTSYRRPKYIFVGSFSIASTKDKTLTLRFSVRRIWVGRRYTRCRRNYRKITGSWGTPNFGEWVKQKNVLGLSMRVGDIVTLTFTKKGDGMAQLCGKRCVTLKKNPPRLAAEWLHPKRDGSGYKFPEGALIKLHFEESTAKIEIMGRTPSGLTYLWGNAILKHQSGDQLQMVFTIRKEDIPKEKMRVLGNLIDGSKPLLFMIRKIPGFRLKICLSNTCTTLLRHFAPHSYDP